MELSNPQHDVSTWNAMHEFAVKACRASLLPDHLKDKPADFMLVAMQAHKWGMDPFAVASCTSVHGGKLMYEGKLVHAALLAMGVLAKPLQYEYTGEGQQRSCKIIGTLANGEVREWTVEFSKVRTIGKRRDGTTFKNAWDNQPDTQLAYRGARDWARMFAPHAMLGVVTEDEELPTEKQIERDVTPGSARERLAALRKKEQNEEQLDADAPIPENDPEAELVTDMIAMVNEAAEGAELSSYARQCESGLAQDANKKLVRRAINNKAASMGLMWDVVQKEFIPKAI